ncbi:hypothetical protein PRZ48_014028 [Zasmidium cellare]|uniref:Zn(2)-C6 fungal-type domain-containing protein n=1 Tax=Zasmidium cellare TaxID=395010 RepID=A0ABR0DZV2_ZASCE|nr:hypothetical protein PRZ48_014028 [Zasmidium cellare]
MSQPLRPKGEFVLFSSALCDSNIIVLPPVAANLTTPPIALITTPLPCDRRFLIRLIDDPQGRSRWITPETARDAESASRIIPPYHPAALNVQAALQGNANHATAVRNHQANLQREAEADRGKQSTRPRPVFVVADAANGTAHVLSRLPRSPEAEPAGEAEGEEEPPAPTGLQAQGEVEGGEQPATPSGPQAPSEEDEDSEDGGIDPDSMPHVGAACARCIEHKRRCNRRRPCQFCLRDGIGEQGCVLPRDSSSPEPTTSLRNTVSNQPLVATSTPSVAENVEETSSAKSKRKREESGTPKATPTKQPVQGSSTPAPPMAPTTPVRPAPSNTGSLNTTNRTGGRRQNTRPRRQHSPMPFRGRNFLTDEEQKVRNAWIERHKNDDD